MSNFYKFGISCALIIGVGCGSQVVEFPEPDQKFFEPVADLPCDCQDSGPTTPVLTKPGPHFSLPPGDDSGSVTPDEDAGTSTDTDAGSPSDSDSGSNSDTDSGGGGGDVDSGDDGQCNEHSDATCEQKLHCCMNTCKPLVKQCETEQHVLCVHACAKAHRICVFERLPPESKAHVCSKGH